MAEGGDIPHLVESKNSEMEDTCVDQDMFKRFIEKSKSDRMYELRNLQHGERPVTSTDHRQSIDTFFSKRLQAQDKAANSGKENVPVNVENVEEVRPETVVVEIQGLVNQQRVSNVLSTGFRQRLENIIRGSISTVSRNVNSRGHSASSPEVPSEPRISPPHAPEVPSQVHSEARVPPQIPDMSPPRPRAAAAAAAPVNQRVPSQRQMLMDRFIERSRSNSTSSSLSDAPVTYRVPTPPAVPSVNVNNAPETVADFHQQLETAFDNGEITLEGLHREEIVQEISELVHQQLVTSALQGSFRSILEVTMREHQSMTGADGQRVQQFVQNIHPTQPIIRNDFSNLGLHPPQEVDNFDNISVTSVSTHNVPFTQSNAYLSREMQSLKSQIEEMKNMLRVSFDLQLDIQRAIRQEVAAAVSKHVDGNTAADNTARSKPVNDTHCCICLDSFADAVLYQCGHMCLCYSCGRHLMSRGSKCPVCRAPIKDIIRAYRSTED